MRRAQGVRTAVGTLFCLAVFCGVAHTATIECPADITLANAPGLCAAPVSFTASASPGASVFCAPASGSHFPVGATTVECTAVQGTTSASCSFEVEVADAEAPTLLCPPSVTRPADPGTCSAFVDPGQASVTDNCGPLAIVGTRSDSMPLVGPYPVGLTTIDWMTTDAGGQMASCTLSVQVLGTEGSAIQALTVDRPVLWPPNHKMVNVTVSYTVTSDCGTATPTVCTLGVTSDEPVAGTGQGDVAPDWTVVDAHRASLRAERAGSGDGRVYTIAVSCGDGNASVITRTIGVSVPHNGP